MKPYLTLAPGLIFKKSALMFRGVSSGLATKNFKLNIKKAEFDIEPEDYVAISIYSSIFYFIFVSLIFYLITTRMGMTPELIISLVGGAIIALFVFIQNMKLPIATINRKVKKVEKNLIPAVRDMVVQMNSGIPIFDIMVNISLGKYGAISQIFKRATKEISAGKPQIVVLEKVANATPSLLFRRMLWQIVNAMKIGAPISDVMHNSLENLYEDQAIQIQKYGSNLGGLAMFYMLIAVIMPALFFTITIIISMFLKISSAYYNLFFFIMMLFTLLLQVFFLGIIRVRRPALV